MVEPGHTQKKLDVRLSFTAVCLVSSPVLAGKSVLGSILTTVGGRELCHEANFPAGARVSHMLSIAAGNKLHARTVTQKLQLLEGSLQLAMSIGEWLVMPSEIYELSRKFIALLKANSFTPLSGHRIIVLCLQQWLAVWGGDQP